MRKRIEIERDEEYVTWRYEDSASAFSSTLNQWEIYELERKLVESGADHNLLMEYADLIREQTQAEQDGEEF